MEFIRRLRTPPGVQNKLRFIKPFKQWPASSMIVFVLLVFLVTSCDIGGNNNRDGIEDNQWPTADFSAKPDTGAIPLLVTFDASASSDTDGTIASFDWDFGDKTRANGNPIDHEYSETGTYTATLKVTDNDGAWAEANTSIEVHRTIWTFRVNKPVYYSAPAIADDGTIYFATGILIHTSYGSLYAVSPDGELKWKFDLDNNSDDDNIWTNDNNGASPAVGIDGTIYIMDHRNVIYAVNPDGSLKWKNNTYESDHSWHVGQKTPAIGSDGTLYVCAGRILYALDPVNGLAKWQTETLRGGNVCAVSAVIGVDGTIYLASNDRFYAIKPDGTHKWPSPYELVAENEKSFSSPAIGADGSIYFGAEGTGDVYYHVGYVYAVNADGTHKWRYVVPGSRQVRASPAIAPDGTVYITTKAYFDEIKQPAYCVALRPEDGSVKWIYQIEPNPDNPVAQDSYTTPAVGADGIIYIAAETGFIYALNPDGTLKWKENFYNGINWSSPVILPDGTLYIGGHDNTPEIKWAGKFVAIRTESYGLANSPWPKFRKDNRNTGRYGP